MVGEWLARLVALEVRSPAGEPVVDAGHRDARVNCLRSGARRSTLALIRPLDTDRLADEVPIEPFDHPLFHRGGELVIGLLVLEEVEPVGVVVVLVPWPHPFGER